ncbi:MAG: glycosyltransferase family protein [Azoarcus sp.]|jgi:GT2 family glycosyltransferase|nr:glycosyltransferase family protein [Azoarcus sp.]
MKNTLRFSIVICSIDPMKFAEASEMYESLLAGLPYEIIGIHDARSLAEGYNRGLLQARGGIVIFSHDDILILDPDFARKISARLQDFDILGFTGTRRLISGYWWTAGLPWASGVIASTQGTSINLSVWNIDPWPVVDGIQAIDGLCIMARRETAREIGFDETTFDGFHLYDLDFSFSAWRAGKRLGVCCDIPVIHASSGNFGSTYQEYTRLFLAKYRNVLPCSSPPVSPPAGRATPASDSRALITLWRRESFQRDAIAQGPSHEPGCMNPAFPEPSRLLTGQAQENPNE